MLRSGRGVGTAAPCRTPVGVTEPTCHRPHTSFGTRSGALRPLRYLAPDLKAGEYRVLRLSNASTAISRDTVGKSSRKMPEDDSDQVVNQGLKRHARTTKRALPAEVSGSM